LKRAKPVDPLRNNLRGAIEKLEEAGVLEVGEATADAVLECASSKGAEIDRDFRGLMHGLQVLSSCLAKPFSRLAFFPIQVENSEEAVPEMVSEFARLAQSERSLADVRVTSLDGGQIAFANADEFPSPNAKVEFALDGELFSVPFVMFEKNLPIGLFDELAKIFNRAAPARRFVSAYSDLLVIAFIDNDNVPTLERNFSEEFEPYASI